MSNNKEIKEGIDRINKKLDILIIIMLTNAGMKLPDIAQTLGVSVRTIQRMFPVAKLKYAKGKSDQLPLEESIEPSKKDEVKSNAL